PPATASDTLSLHDALPILEPKLKEETELIFEELGISTTEAIRVFFKQVNLQRGLPFELKIPNEVTKNAIQDAENRTDLTSVDSKIGRASCRERESISVGGE